MILFVLLCHVEISQTMSFPGVLLVLLEKPLISRGAILWLGNVWTSVVRVSGFNVKSRGSSSCDSDSNCLAFVETSTRIEPWN